MTRETKIPCSDSQGHDRNKEEGTKNDKEMTGLITSPKMQISGGPTTMPITKTQVATVDLSDYVPGVPLGLVLAPGPLGALETSFITVVSGWEFLGPIQRSGQVGLGDRLVCVNGSSITHMTFRQNIDVLKSMLKSTSKANRLHSMGFVPIQIEDTDTIRTELSSQSSYDTDSHDKDQKHKNAILMEEIASLKTRVEELQTDQFIVGRSSLRGLLNWRGESEKSVVDSAKDKVIAYLRRELAETTNCKAETERNYLNNLELLEDEKRQRQILAAELADQAIELENLSKRQKETMDRNKELEKKLRHMKKKLKNKTHDIEEPSDANSKTNIDCIDDAEMHGSNTSEMTSLGRDEQIIDEQMEVQEDSSELIEEDVKDAEEEMAQLKSKLERTTDAIEKESRDKPQMMETDYSKSLAMVEDETRQLAIVMSEISMKAKLIDTETKVIEIDNGEAIEKNTGSQNMEDTLIEMRHTLEESSDFIDELKEENSNLEKVITTKSKLFDDLTKEITIDKGEGIAINSDVSTNEMILSSNVRENQIVSATLAEKELIICDLDKEIKHLIQKLDERQSVIGKLSEENFYLQTEVSTAESKSYEGLQQAMETCNRELTEAMTKRQETEEVFTILEMAKIKDEMRDLSQKLEDIMTYNPEKLSNENSALQKEIETKASLYEDLRKQTEDDIQELVDEVQELTQKLEDNTCVIAKLSKENSTLQKDVEMKSNIYDELRKQTEGDKQELVRTERESLENRKCIDTKMKEIETLNGVLIEEKTKNEVLEDQLMQITQNLEVSKDFAVELTKTKSTMEKAEAKQHIIINDLEKDIRHLVQKLNDRKVVSVKLSDENSRLQEEVSIKSKFYEELRQASLRKGTNTEEVSAIIDKAATEDEIRELTQKLEVSKKALEKMSCENSDLKKQIEKESSIRDELQKQMDGDRQELTVMELEISSKSKFIDLKMKEIKDLNSNLSKEKISNKAMEEQLDHITHNLEESTTLVDTLTDENSSVKKALLTKTKICDDLTKELEDLEGERAAALSDLSKHDKVVLSTGLSERECRIKDLEVEIRQLIQNLDERKSMTDKLSAENSHLQAEVSIKSKLYEELKHEMENCSRELTEAIAKREETEENSSRLDMDQTEDEMKELTQKLEDMTHTLENLSNENSALQKDIDAKASLYEDLRKQTEDSFIDTGRKEIESLKDVLIEEKTRNEELEDQVKQITQKLEESATLVHRITEENSTLERTIMTKSKLCDVLTTEAEEGKCENAAILSDLENEKKMLSDGLAEKESRINDLEIQVDDMMQHFDERKKMTLTLSDENSCLQEEVSIASKLYDGLKQEMEEYKIQLAEAIVQTKQSEETSTRLDEMERRNNTLNDEIRDLTQKLEDKTRTFEKLLNENKIYLAEAIVQTKQSEETSTRLDEMERRNNTLNDEIRELTQKLEDTTRTLEKLLNENKILQNDIEAKSRMLEEMTDQMEDDERELAVMESGLSKQMEVIDGKNRQNKEMAAKLAKSECRNENLEKEILLAKEEIENRSCAIESLHDEHTKASKRHSDCILNLQNECAANLKCYEDLKEDNVSMRVLHSHEIDELKREAEIGTKYVESLREEMIDSDRCKTHLAVQLEEKTRTLEKLLDEKSVLQTSIEAKSRLFEEMKNQMDDDQRDFAVMESTISKQVELIDSKTRQNEEMVAKLAENKCRNEKLEEGILLAKEEIENRSRAIESLHHEYTKTSKRDSACILNLQKECVANLKHYEEIKEENTTMKVSHSHQIVELKREIEVGTKYVETLEDMIDSDRYKAHQNNILAVQRSKEIQELKQELKDKSDLLENLMEEMSQQKSEDELRIGKLKRQLALKSLVIDSSNTKEHTQDGNALLQIKRLSRELENKNKALKGQLAKMRSNESYCAEQQKLRLDPGRDKSHTCCIGDIANSKEGATGDFDEKVQVEAAKMEQLKNSLLEKDEYIIKLETEMEELRNRIRYVSKKSRLEINKLKNRLDEIAFAKDAQAQEIASLKRKLFEKIHT